jgi:peptidoglycan/xylan/chitin deacetylase (PgdA/CDA1 family)
MFWGVADSRSVADYGRNIQGSLIVIPKMLQMFQRYGIRATWATVGMLMCRDFSQWQEIRPQVYPGYSREKCSTYSLAPLAREYPALFFGRPLVTRILDTPGQEVGTHTYSHYYCSEAGASPEQFAADLACAVYIGAELGVAYRSIVFPRNQVREGFLPALDDAGIRAFRGNPNHWIYRDGHVTPAGMAGRAIRFADTWVNLTGMYPATPTVCSDKVDVPASMFLRPWSKNLHGLEGLKMKRIKRAMSDAASRGENFHLWWHPHNFGLDIERNLNMLELILQHFEQLRHTHGMRSQSMGDLVSIGEQ